MGIVEFFILAAFIGFVAWVLTTFIPMPSQIKQAIIVAAIIVIVLTLMQSLGIIEHDVAIPKLVH